MTLYEALKGRFGLSDTCGECPHHNRDCYTQNVNLHDICEVINAPGMKPKGEWISVKDRLPDNANHPGCFCPRYIVYTDFGITEGWYNPDSGCWYGFLTFMTEEYSRWNIDLEHGDVPKTVKNLPVKYWMPFPELPKMEWEKDE